MSSKSSPSSAKMSESSPPPNARVIWGAKVNNEIEGRIRAMVVLAGVDSPFLQEREKAVLKKEQAKPKVVKINSKKKIK